MTSTLTPAALALADRHGRREDLEQFLEQLPDADGALFARLVESDHGQSRRLRRFVLSQRNDDPGGLRAEWFSVLDSIPWLTRPDVPRLERAVYALEACAAGIVSQDDLPADLREWVTQATALFASPRFLGLTAQAAHVQLD